ncbi:MAG: hypothetical protein WAW41_16975, partial [Methylobacter sp.]
MLVTADNVEGFSSAIVNLLSNPDRFNLMRQAAQKAAQEKFTLQRMINDYEQLFAEEDNWFALAQRNIAGWSLEVLRELIHKNPDGTFRFKRKLSTLKNVIIPNHSNQIK